jgi:hypothetical protein
LPSLPMSSTNPRMYGRQSGVIAEPSFLEDESFPAGFHRFVPIAWLCP